VTVGSAARRGIDTLAAVVRIVGMLIVTVLVVHIALTLLQANPANFLASRIRDAADALSLGLQDLFLPAEPWLAVLLNYGTAALIWFAITTILVRLIRRIP
jgi:hypothetical protein